MSNYKKDYPSYNLNRIKIISVIVLSFIFHIIFFIKLFFSNNENITISIFKSSLLYLFIIGILFCLYNFFLNTITVQINASNEYDRILKIIERYSALANIKTPKLKIIEIDNLIFSTDIFSTTIFISRNLLSTDERSISYMICREIYNLQNKYSSLISFMTIFIFYSLLVMDIFFIFLVRKDLVILSRILSYLLIPLLFLKFLISKLLITKHRFFNADLAAIKLLNTNNGFLSILNILSISKFSDKYLVPFSIYDQFPVLYDYIPFSFFIIGYNLKDRERYISGYL